MMRVASQVVQQSCGPLERSSLRGLELDNDLWLLAAKDMYKERMDRRRFFSPDLFGEPAWDILLDLYIAEKENEPVSVSAACLGAQVPMTTALRYLKLLEEQGLITREPDARDGRRHHVRISDKGYAQMTAYIAEQRKVWLTDDPLQLDCAQARDGPPALSGLMQPWPDRRLGSSAATEFDITTSTRRQTSLPPPRMSRS
jgi:DNA-binding MarR family transcriptional regulator